MLVWKKETERVLLKKFGVQLLGDLKKEVSEMCNLSQGLIERGMEKEKRETAFRMQKEDCSLDLIALAVDQPVETVEEWLGAAAE